MSSQRLCRNASVVFLPIRIHSFVLPRLLVRNGSAISLQAVAAGIGYFFDQFITELE
ncbi:MAG: hypothetical protein HRU09_12400 [Oligoflexales bacterium]|nr:hypothetical protein [Oligoflexales bacterium]